MKKFYSIFLVVMALLSTIAVQAQYNTITDLSATQHLISDPATWVGGIQPPNPCIGCTIRVKANVVYTTASGVLTLQNSTLIVEGSNSVELDNYIYLDNTAVDIGNDPTGSASFICNDQVYLSNGSYLQLANQNTFINTNNIAGNPVNGSISDYASGSTIAGIYTFSGEAAAQPDGYYITLNGFGYGNATGTIGGAQYTLNCGGASPNTCGGGFVYGPTKSQEFPTNNFYGFFMTTAVLPVQLVQFLALKNDDGTVGLTWATSQEVNSGSFEVERTSDQITWTTLGSVKAKGFSSVSVNYNYTDKSPVSGIGYYRLKMIDLDGKYKYSNIVSVSSDAATQALVVYSNPFVDQVRVKVNVDQSDMLNLTITDMVGKVYFRQSFAAAKGDNLINMVPNSAASGMYILHIRGNTYDKTVKLIKQ